VCHIHKIKTCQEEHIQGRRDLTHHLPAANLPQVNMDLTFSHPDYTVGFGIPSNLRLTESGARGLYRRSGISAQDY